MWTLEETGHYAPRLTIHDHENGQVLISIENRDPHEGESASIELDKDMARKMVAELERFIDVDA